MSGKGKLALRLTLILSVIAVVSEYIVLSLYYAEGFSCGTWINGISCAGLSVEQVNDILLEGEDYDGVKIIAKDGEELTITNRDIHLRLDYTRPLQDILDKQQSFAWGLNLFIHDKGEVMPDVIFNENELREKVNSWEVFELNNAELVSVQRTDEGRFIMVETTVERPDPGKVFNLAKTALGLKEKVVELKDARGSYVIMKPDTDTAEVKEMKEAVENIEKVLDYSFEYKIDSGEPSEENYKEATAADLRGKEQADTETAEENEGDLAYADTQDGEEIEIPEEDEQTETGISDEIRIGREQMAGWILTEEEYNSFSKGAQSDETSNPYYGQYIVNGERVYEIPDKTETYGGIMTDEHGNPVISLAKVYDFVSDRFESYGTKNMLEKYHNTKDKQERDSIRIVISKEKGVGSLVNVDEEMEYLVDSMLSGEDGEHDLSFSEGTYVVYGSQLGDEYIEVNMGDQILTYYKDGEIVQQFPVVTGLMGRGRATPTGLYHIYNKRYHTILRGFDYETFVNYWLGVHRGIGIHDATWRKEFGGDIYVASGSHGCINCPKDEMEKLYSSIKTGVPVILYY